MSVARTAAVLGVALAVVALAVVALAGLAPAGRAASAPDGQIVPVMSAPMPNLPGETMHSIVVAYPPGGKSGPHRHAGSGFIFAYVLSGEIRSAVEGETPRVYRAGESWTEPPGAHHVVSENASTTEPARLLVVAVAKTGDTLTVFDKPRATAK